MIFPFKKKVMWKVKTIRYRYLKDDISGKTPTKTEYELYKDDKLIQTAHCGGRFLNVNQFIKRMIKHYKIESEIIKEKPYFVSLGYKVNRI